MKNIKLHNEDYRYLIDKLAAEIYHLKDRDGLVSIDLDDIYKLESFLARVKRQTTDE